MLNKSMDSGMALALKRPSHAYLLLGQKNQLKFIAKTFATQVMKAEDPGDSLRWTYEVAPIEDKKINLQQIKEAIKFANQATSRTVRSKVIIIHQADNMGIEASNALLLTLEEPPIRTTFILTAQGPESLPRTIVSRVQIIRIAHESVPSEISDLARQFFSARLLDRLLIVAQNDEKREAQALIDDLGNILIGSTDERAVKRAEALILAQSHLYNNGNPRFVLECLALEFE